MAPREVHGGATTAYSKIVVMIFFLAIDLGFNCILDYDKFNNEFNNSKNRVLLALYGLQIVIEISVFLVLFLAMADTFLFRVGLLGLLIKKFRTVLIFHPIYLALTLALGGYRVRLLTGGRALDSLWDINSFVVLSHIQKIVAIPYYLLNIRATMKLSAPIYFTKDAWVALAKELKAESYE
jgi:hypothetical protein